MQKEYTLNNLQSEKKLQSVIDSSELSKQVEIKDRVVTHPSASTVKIVWHVEVSRSKDIYALDLLVQFANL